MLSNLNENQEIHKIQVYGHESRIFRCKVLKNSFITAGEDAIVNIWSHDGQLQKKIVTSQGSAIWSLDCDEHANSFIVGCGDGGIRTFPISVKHSEQNIMLPNSDKPKVMGILDIDRLVVVSEKSKLYYYLCSENNWQEINHFEDTKNYVLLEVSKCKEIVALAGKWKLIIFVYEMIGHNFLINLGIVELKCINYINNWKLFIKNNLSFKGYGDLTDNLKIMSEVSITNLCQYTQPLSVHNILAEYEI